MGVNIVLVSVAESNGFAFSRNSGPVIFAQIIFPPNAIRIALGLLYSYCIWYRVARPTWISFDPPP